MASSGFGIWFDQNTATLLIAGIVIWILWILWRHSWKRWKETAVQLRAVTTDYQTAIKLGAEAMEEHDQKASEFRVTQALWNDHRGTARLNEVMLGDAVYLFGALECTVLWDRYRALLEAETQPDRDWASWEAAVADNRVARAAWATLGLPAPAQ